MIYNLKTILDFSITDIHYQWEVAHQKTASLAPPLQEQQAQELRTRLTRPLSHSRMLIASSRPRPPPTSPSWPSASVRPRMPVMLCSPSVAAAMPAATTRHAINHAIVMMRTLFLGNNKQPFRPSFLGYSH